MNRRGLWPGVFTKTSGVPSTATHEIVGQMVLTHAIIGFIGASVFRATRRLPSPALQEKIAKSLFIPLAIGDVTYLLGIFYGIGDVRWKLNNWPQTLWLSVIVGIGFFIPRCVEIIPSQNNDIDRATGFAGSSVSEDTSRLVTAGWTARINIKRSSRVVTEAHPHVFGIS